MIVRHEDGRLRVVTADQAVGAKTRGWSSTDPVKPALSDLKATWVAYAEASGDHTGGTKAELVERHG